jgi:hypothetical protein
VGTRLVRGCLRGSIIRLDQSLAQHPGFDFLSADVGEHVPIHLDTWTQELPALLNHFLSLLGIVDNVPIFKGQVVLPQHGSHALTPPARRLQIGHNSRFVHISYNRHLKCHIATSLQLPIYPTTSQSVRIEAPPLKPDRTPKQGDRFKIIDPVPGDSQVLRFEARVNVIFEAFRSHLGPVWWTGAGKLQKALTSRLAPLEMLNLSLYCVVIENTELALLHGANLEPVRTSGFCLKWLVGADSSAVPARTLVVQQNLPTTGGYTGDDPPQRFFLFNANDSDRTTIIIQRRR